LGVQYLYRRVGMSACRHDGIYFCRCRYINTFMVHLESQTSSLLRRSTALTLGEMSMHIARHIPPAVRQYSRQQSHPLSCLTRSQKLTPVRNHGYHASAGQLRSRLLETSGNADQQRLYSRARRRFSTSPVAMHGHLDPPKPGEE